MGGDTYLLTSSPVKQTFSIEDSGSHAHTQKSFTVPLPTTQQWDDEAKPTPRTLPIRPNRRRGEDIELGGHGGLTESNVSLHNLHYRQVNPMVSNFTSPIGKSEKSKTVIRTRANCGLLCFRLCISNVR